MEIVTGIFLVFGLLLVGVLVFGGWLVIAFLRLLWRALSGGGRNDQSLPPRRFVWCPNAGCRAQNPPVARFCRHCGRAMLAGAGPAVVRRVA